MGNRIGFSRRAGAVLLDLIIVCSVAATMKTVGHSLFGPQSPWLQSSGKPGDGWMEPLRSFFNPGLLAMVLFPIYGLTEPAWGWTLGKRLLGLRILNEDGSGPGRRQMTLRYCLKWGPDVLGLVALIPILGVVRTAAGFLNLLVAAGCLLALGSRRQAFHDRVAATAVFAPAKVALPQSVAMSS